MPNRTFVDTLQHAVADGGRRQAWDAVLEGFQKAFQADTASVIWSPGGGAATYAAVRNLPERMATDYVDRYQYLDELRPLIHQPLHQGRIYLYSRVARERMTRSEFYNDFILRNGIVDGVGGVFRLADGNLALGGQFESTPHHVPELLPIFNLTIARLRLFANQRERDRHLRAARDGPALRDDATYLTLDANGRIDDLVEGAYELGYANDLAVGGDGSTILRQMLAGTATPDHPSIPRRSTLVMAEGALLRCRMWAIGEAGGAAADAETSAWIVELRPMNSVDLGAHERVSDLLDLTSRETTLSLLIAAGLSLRSAAIAMGITYESARTYTKRIQQKLELSSHAELALTIRTIISHEDL
ncbi:MAG: LuxR C-terminal-related transcriptional regulator [Azospirillaceae bacterium]